MHTRHYPEFALPLYSRLRARWNAGLSCRSDVQFAIGVSLLWLLIYNVPFWQHSLAAMWRPNGAGVLFIGSLLLVVFCAQAVLVLMWPGRLMMRAATSVLFLMAAAGSYFCGAYGAIMNKDMMRNVLQTDPMEIGGLMNPELLLHLLLLGVVPALLVWRVRLPATGLKVRLGQNAIFICAALSVSLLGMFASSANYAVFFREYKPVRFMLSPASEAVSVVGLLAETRNAQKDGALIDPAGSAQRTAPPHARPLVLFLVIGETARAANFQLGGYPRATNPELMGLDGLAYFPRTAACGTSTAVSVPCIFSHLGRDKFDVDQAQRYTNLLDSLVKAGFDVEWRDNNSGCKGVCARVSSIDYAASPASHGCSRSGCFDEVMLADLPDKLQAISRDTVIVFHQNGSHGPAYYERYPPQFEKFAPACHSNQLQHCTPEEITNAYDNSLAYTSHVLARQIALLRAAADRVDGALLYASDHGESLGENGIYLHGMPYAFAPAVQKEVPMLFWVSDSYAQRMHLRTACLKDEAALPVSHDFLYHTVLGATEVRNQVYDYRLDLVAGCRRHSGGHE